MENEFSDVSYGKTEKEACNGLMSGILARYVKVRKVYPLDSDKIIERDGNLPVYLHIEPYGNYLINYQPINGQYMASISYTK